MNKNTISPTAAAAREAASAVGGTHDVNNSIRFTHYVIITDIGATLVSFEYDNIMSTLDVDAWDESWLTNFRKFKLDNSIYRKVERVQ